LRWIAVKHVCTLKYIQNAVALRESDRPKIGALNDINAKEERRVAFVHERELLSNFCNNCVPDIVTWDSCKQVVDPDSHQGETS
jgi:hypothetical protein